MAEGWIKLHRKILKSDMWQELNSKQRDITMSLLLMANHSSGQAQAGRELISLKPGQFYSSLSGILQNCAKDVTPQNLKTALKKLEQWGFIKNESTKTGRIITICNWGRYQATPELTRHPGPQPEPVAIEPEQEPENEPERQGPEEQPKLELGIEGQEPAGQEQPEPEPKPKKEKVKKKNQRRQYPAEFEEFWSVYPRTKKMNKRKTYEYYRVLVEEDEEKPENIIRAAKNFAAEVEGREEKFIKYPTTFLGTDRPYQDYVDEQPEPEPDGIEIFGRQYDEDFLQTQLEKAISNF